MMAFRNVPFLAWAGIRGGISVALLYPCPTALRGGDFWRRPTRSFFSALSSKDRPLGYVAKRTVLPREEDEVKSS